MSKTEENTLYDIMQMAFFVDHEDGRIGVSFGEKKCYAPHLFTSTIINESSDLALKEKVAKLQREVLSLKKERNSLLFLEERIQNAIILLSGED